MAAEPDINLYAYFLKPQEGGRQTNIHGAVYNCPIRLGKQYFDCRIIINAPPIELGKTYDLPAILLDRENAFKFLQPGQEVALWEGKDIAKCRILAMGNHDKRSESL